MGEHERLGVPRRIVGFVMPTGYSFNLDGTIALSRNGFAVCRPGGRAGDWSMSFGRQIVMMLTLMITFKRRCWCAARALVILLADAERFMPVRLGSNRRSR